jgi:subtilisin family serine protease
MDHAHDQFAVPSIEALEVRVLLSHHHVGVPTNVTWAPYGQLAQQAAETENFPTIDGSGVTIAEIDRGIDYNMPELGGGIGKHHKVIGGVNFRDSSGILLDDTGHGTGVAGIMAANGYTLNGLYNQGVAPQAQILDLKQESSANIKAALDWVIANAKKYNIQVINLTDFMTNVLPGAFNPTIYNSELKTLWRMGIFVVSPVGNGVGSKFKNASKLAITYPALSPYVMGVGGFDQTGNLWFGSRRGTGLDILAPADNVTMPFYILNRKHVGYDQYDDRYDGTPTIVNNENGTSWASAFVAGTAALIKQVNSAITPAQIQQVLLDSATPITDATTGVSYKCLNINGAVAVAIQRYGAAAQAKPARATAVTANTFSTMVIPSKHAADDDDDDSPLTFLRRPSDS